MATLTISAPVPGTLATSGECATVLILSRWLSRCVASGCAEVSFDSALTRLRKVVYKNRVRVKEFLVDFDKLRSGFVHPNNFLSALSMAKLDAELSAKELQIICDTYTVPRSPSLIMVDYKCVWGGFASGPLAIYLCCSLAERFSTTSRASSPVR